MNKTDAWMPLWIGAYLGDTMRLTTIQHGAYLLLLMAYWRDRAPLPDDDDELRSITKASKEEWKKMRPVLAKFFRVDNGVWWHKRIERELEHASERNAKAKSKAKAGAQARWKDHSKNASSIPVSNAPSIPQAMHEECPTPTPSPSISVVESRETHTEQYSEQRARARVPAGEICKRLIALGIEPATCNPGHPTLQALLEAGAELPEFEAAARGSGQAGFA
jgi:uncharacterized protein YdaU (DUF1376 family)